MDYIELTVSISPKEVGSDVLIAEMSELDFDTFSETSAGFLAYIKQDAYDKEKLEGLIEQYANTFDISYEVQTIVQQNWNAEWEENFQPIDVKNRCYVRAPFHAAKTDYQYEIVIEPKMSFGTGHHSTTQLMIQHLMSLNVCNRSVLDMGCGTGVLAILAAKMQASHVTAIDIDQWSYENTLENIQVNDQKAINVLHGDASLLANIESIDIILANINKNILLADLSHYANKLNKGGDLLLSGFFETDMLDIQNCAESLGLTFRASLNHEGWAMLHFIH